MFITTLLFKRSLVLRTIALISLVVSALAVVFLLNINLASAAEIDEGIAQVNNSIALGASDPRVIITRIINIALGFLGILAVGLVVYAGYLWMTSGGDEEKVRKAKKILINAVIGLAIILSAWGITLFILNKLGGATGIGGPGGGGGGGGSGGGALGNGIIESHYPARNATGVPRNTKIMVTFKEAMAVDTIMDETASQINADNIKIYRTYCTGPASPDGGQGGPDGACQSEYNEGFDNALSADQVKANKTADDKTFIFSPVDWLGSPEENIWYTVYLGGGINKANGDSAFGGLGSYDWQFEVSTELDLDPPHLISVIPKHCADQATCKTWPRNVVVQFNFNEAMVATSVTGQTLAGFHNLTVYNRTGQAAVEGTFIISNQYKTVEFITNDWCGKNSCGGDVYCLPPDAEIAATAKAATLLICNQDIDCESGYQCSNQECQSVADQNKYYPEAAFPYDGAVDACGNSLDGNDAVNRGPNKLGGDKKAQGAVDDDFFWTFFTNNTIDLTPPKINEVDPAPGASGVSKDKIIDILFSKLMMKSTLKPDCKYKDDNGNDLCYISLLDKEIGFWISAYDEIDKTHAQIDHTDFSAGADYSLEVTSEVKDIFQNCYQPCCGPSGGEATPPPGAGQCQQ